MKRLLRSISCFAILTGIMVYANHPVFAEDVVPARGYDMFDLRAGGGWVFGADTEVTVIGKRGLGTAVDFDQTLGGDSSKGFFRLDGTWRWSQKNSLNFTWYQVNRSGSRVLNQQIDFGDKVFDVGAGVDSELDMGIYKMLYRYGVARTDQIDFDLGAGLYVANIKTALTATTSFGSTTVGTSQESVLTAPLPTVGMQVDCKLTPKLHFLVLTDLFYFKYNDWEGSMGDLQTGLEYRFARNWSIGAAYDRLNLNLSGPVDPGSFSVRNGWNSLYSYVAFHW